MDEQRILRFLSEIEEQSPHWQSAACALSFMGAETIPLLCHQYRHAASPMVRQAIVAAVDRYRRPEDIPFFGEVLRDPEEEVWQAAVDALVSQPGQQSLDVLRLALQEVTGSPRPDKNKLLFFEDAVRELQKPHPYAVGEGWDAGASGTGTR